MANMNFDGMDDLVEALKEVVKNPNDKTNMAQNEKRSVLHNDRNNTQTANTTQEQTRGEENRRKKFTTFFRTKAMMRVEYDDENIWFTFMSASTDNSKQYNKVGVGTNYDKNTMTKLKMHKEELFQFVHNLQDFANALFSNKQPPKVQIVHSPRENEKKILDMSVGKDGKTALLTLTNGNNSFVISFSPSGLKYLLFVLKMILYELYVGTRVGFTYDWI